MELSLAPLRTPHTHQAGPQAAALFPPYAYGCESLAEIYIYEAARRTGRMREKKRHAPSLSRVSGACARAPVSVRLRVGPE
eukprot:scaffold8551_cov132-Isochrysis_galbana.AAC.6